jgi:hypothetical protein
MKKQLFITFTSLTVAIVCTINHSVYQSGRFPASLSKGLTEHNYTRSFIALNRDIKVDGPINIPKEDGEYTKRIFGLVIQEADRLAKDDWYYPSENIWNNYYTFLVTSLQVPFHESGLSHLRKRDQVVCSHYSNDFISPKYKADNPIEFYTKRKKEAEEALKNETNKRKIAQLKKDIRIYKIKLSNANYLLKNIPNTVKVIGTSNPFPHCEDLRGDDIHQLQFSNDYADVGIMMINSHAHQKIFASGKIFSTHQTIKYGLNHLYKYGFNLIANDSSKFDCLKGLEEKDSKLYRNYLIRGSWAGRYNSGSAKKTCRFLNPKDKFYNNDVVYKRNLDKLLIAEKYKSFYHHFLPIESIERSAFFEILDNFKNGTNNRKYLNQVLKTIYTDREAAAEVIEQNIANQPPEEKVPEQNSIDNQPAAKAEVTPVGTTTLTEQEKDEAQPNVDRDQQSQIENDPMPDYNIDNLAQTNSDDFTHIITIKSLSFRSEPIIHNRTFCGSTHAANSHPVQVKVLELNESESFAKVEANDLRDYVVRNLCKDLEFYYVSKKYIKQIEKFSPQRKVRLKTWVWSRDIPNFVTGNKLALLNKDDIVVVTEEKTLEDNSIWLKVMLNDGTQGWIFSNEFLEDIP